MPAHSSYWQEIAKWRAQDIRDLRKIIDTYRDCVDYICLNKCQKKWGCISCPLYLVSPYLVTDRQKIKR